VAEFKVGELRLLVGSSTINDGILCFG